MQQQLARANEAMARSARRLQATRNTPYQLMASWGKEAAPFASALPNGAQSGGADHQGRTSEPLI